MKKIITLIIALGLSLYAKGDLHIFDVDNSAEKITPATIEKTLAANGFGIALNNDMTTPFKKQFQKSDFKIFTLMTIYEPKLDDKLVKKYPYAGIFIPKGIGIYQHNDENTLHVSVLTSDAEAKIIGIANNDILKSIESKVLKSLQAALPNAKQRLSEDSLKESRDLVTVYEYQLDGADWEDARGEIKMNLEGAFAPRGFIMPASMDYDADVFQGDDSDNPFDFYETYSICKLPVIYTVAKSRPEASAFAPCTTIVYKKKDEDKIVIGFPAVYNWMSSAKVQDKAAQEVLMKAQKDFEAILKEVTE